MSTEQIQKLKEQLDALKIFPNNIHVRELRKQIKGKLSKLENKELKKRSLESKKQTSSMSRSKKLKKYHRYIRLIRNNFPELSVSEIRKQFSVRKKGHDVSIPDVIWQNPSP